MSAIHSDHPPHLKQLRQLHFLADSAKFKNLEQAREAFRAIKDCAADYIGDGVGYAEPAAPATAASPAPAAAATPKVTVQAAASAARPAPVAPKTNAFDVYKSLQGRARADYFNAHGAEIWAAWRGKSIVTAFEASQITDRQRWDEYSRLLKADPTAAAKFRTANLARN